MSGRVDKALALATLLHRHREEIAAAWAEMVHRLPDSRYQQQPMEELRNSTMRGSTAIIEALGSGSHAALEAYLTEVSLTRLEMGFDIAKVIEALLLFEDAALPFVWRAYPPGSTMAQETAVLINECLRRMIAHFANLYTSSVSRRLRDLEALYRADEEVSRSLELDKVLNALVRVTVEALGADKSSLMVWDEALGKLVARATYGFGPETVRKMTFALGEGVVGRVAVTGQAMIVEDTAKDRRVATRVTEPEEIRSFMHVPLEVGGRVFGVFNVSYTRPRAFDQDEQRLFIALADRAALAIEKARLHERAQELAALEERHRLARDLHDAVTQTLFSASLIAEVLPRIWERDREEGRRRLEELRELTRGALAEMRTLLLELRPSALADAALGDLLRQLAESITGRARVPVTVQIEGQCDLPPEVKVALYRIAQEALNNVAKHAGASQAAVSLRCLLPSPWQGEGPGVRVELCISDDGRGFDPESVPSESLGLGIMRERAEAIGAMLEINSQVGHGTQVVVVWKEKTGEVL